MCLLLIVEVIFKNMSKFMVYSLGRSEMMIYFVSEILKKYSEKLSKIMIFQQGVMFFFVFFWKYGIYENILRAFRLETRLTVYWALYIIPKHSGGAKGCLGQHLSVLWTTKR